MQKQNKYNKLKKYTTLGYIVSQILLNLGHVFRFGIFETNLGICN